MGGGVAKATDAGTELSRRSEAEGKDADLEMKGATTATLARPIHCGTIGGCTWAHRGSVLHDCDSSSGKADPLQHGRRVREGVVERDARPREKGDDALPDGAQVSGLGAGA